MFFSKCFTLIFIVCVCVCVRSFGEMLAFTLTAFLELMDHGIVSWDLISISFIKQASYTFIAVSLNIQHFSVDRKMVKAVNKVI